MGEHTQAVSPLISTQRPLSLQRLLLHSAAPKFNSSLLVSRVVFGPGSSGSAEMEVAGGEALYERGARPVPPDNCFTTIPKRSYVRHDPEVEKQEFSI